MKIDGFSKYLEERLYQWAEWYSRGHFYGLGYPPCSIEYRIMREGIVIHSKAGLRPLPSNEAAEEIENYVREMAQQNSIMALALRCQYFNHGSLRAKANQLKKYGVKISHNHFKYYVDMAHQWLAGRLSRKNLFNRQNRFD